MHLSVRKCIECVAALFAQATNARNHPVHLFRVCIYCIFATYDLLFVVARTVNDHTIAVQSSVLRSRAPTTYGHVQIHTCTVTRDTIGRRFANANTCMYEPNTKPVHRAIPEPVNRDVDRPGLVMVYVFIKHLEIVQH